MRLARERARGVENTKAGFLSLGQAATRSAEKLSGFGRMMARSIALGIITVEKPDGTSILAVDPGVPYPTQSGVTDGREALSGFRADLAYIDEASLS